MYKRMLLPVDGSPPSEHAVLVGLVLAQQLQATVVFVHVVEPHRFSDLGNPDEAMSRARTVGQALLEHHQLQATRQELNAISRLEAQGDAARAINDVAHAEHCDLIVLGTHGRTGVPRLLLGSVAERVARLAPTPVLLVRGNDGHPPQRFTRVLFATDGSVRSALALEHADRFAQQLGAHLSVLHVAFDVGYTPAHMGRMLHYTNPLSLEQQFEQARDRLRDHGQTILEEARGRCQTKAVDIDLRESLYELTSEVICRVAEDQHHDLIVMGTHGHTGLRKFLLGSVASEVAHGAKQPVLLVRDLKTDEEAG